MRTRSTRGPVALLGTVFVTTALTAGVTSDAAAQPTCDLLQRHVAARADGVHPLLRQEQDPLQQFQVAHLHD
jgi:hypothetical protein